MPCKIRSPTQKMHYFGGLGVNFSGWIA